MLYLIYFIYSVKKQAESYILVYIQFHIRLKMHKTFKLESFYFKFVNNSLNAQLKWREKCYKN
jgi:hypothetical protein